MAWTGFLCSRCSGLVLVVVCRDATLLRVRVALRLFVDEEVVEGGGITIDYR